MHNSRISTWLDVKWLKLWKKWHFLVQMLIEYEQKFNFCANQNPPNVYVSSRASRLRVNLNCHPNINHNNTHALLLLQLFRFLFCCTTYLLNNSTFILSSLLIWGSILPLLLNWELGTSRRESERERERERKTERQRERDTERGLEVAF